MGEACCAHDNPGIEAKEPQRFIDIAEVRAAAVSGALLVAGLVASDGVGIVLLFAALGVGAFETCPFTSSEHKESDAQGKSDDAQEHLMAGKSDTGADAQCAEDAPEVSSVHGGFFGVLGAFRECVVRSVDLV